MAIGLVRQSNVLSRDRDRYSPRMGTRNQDRPNSSAPVDAPADSPSLELVDYVFGRKSRNKMPGGAYDPYERQDQSGDTVRVEKPRVDLRQLSQWIKLNKEVAALREDSKLSKDKSR
jgi:hypothetical protein